MKNLLPITIKPEGLPQSVIDRLQKLADRYSHDELELYGDTNDLKENEDGNGDRTGTGSREHSENLDE